MFEARVHTLIPALIGTGTTSAEDDPGSPYQGHISPSILVNEGKGAYRNSSITISPAFGNSLLYCITPLVSLSLRLENILGPATRVKKKTKQTP